MADPHGSRPLNYGDPNQPHGVPQYPPPGAQQFPPPQYPTNAAYPAPPQYPSFPQQYPPPQQYPLLQQNPPLQQYPPEYKDTVTADTQPIIVIDVNTMEDSTGIAVFDDKSVRKGFIRKVYALLFVQLLVTTGFICIFVYVPSVSELARNNKGMYWSAWSLSCIFLFAIACCEKVRRSFPMNLIFLGMFTICESYLLGVMSSYYRASEVILAVGIVAVLALAITLFACQTKIDFSMLWGCLYVALIVLVCFGFLTIFYHNKIARIVYASLGALVFGLYLVVDTQLIMGGKKMYSISPEEYIFAALNLYIDIAYLFWFVLKLIKFSR